MWVEERGRDRESKIEKNDRERADQEGYYMSKKSWPILYSKLQYKMGHDLDRQLKDRERWHERKKKSEIT